MAPKHEIELSQVKGSIGFWSSANKPTQELFGLTAQEALLHFKVLYLLTDRVIGAASFYFESEITRRVTHEVRPLAERGELLFFVDAQLEDFVDHGMSKTEKSPRGLTAYENAADVRSRGLYLNSLGHVLRRPSSSISDAIVDYWIQDLVNPQVGSLGEALGRLIKTADERALVIEKLSTLARTRSEDFVWEFVEPKLKEINLPRPFRRLARRRLAQIYSAVTSDLIGATLDKSEHGLVGVDLVSHSRTDSDLFLECMSILGVKNSLGALTIQELIALKQDPQFIIFREFYFNLLEVASYQRESLAQWLPIYKSAAQSYTTRNVTRDEFLASFKQLCASLGRSDSKYDKPLEILLYTYDLFGRAVLDTFIELLHGEAEGSRFGEPVKEDIIISQIKAPEIFERILATIRHMGRTFETTPNTYSYLKEEELRNVLLAHLNGFFRGGAKGECFRNSGKTDILIEDASRSAFVAECKIWHGRSELLKACDQLLRYLTWRDSTVSLIFFNKSVGRFSELLVDMPKILASHPSFRNQLEASEAGEWRSEFSLPNDSNQIVTVHTFLFNLYVVGESVR
jgi:hypothetical protein